MLFSPQVLVSRDAQASGAEREGDETALVEANEDVRGFRRVKIRCIRFTHTRSYLCNESSDYATNATNATNATHFFRQRRESVSRAPKQIEQLTTARK